MSHLTIDAGRIEQYFFELLWAQVTMEQLTRNDNWLRMASAMQIEACWRLMGRLLGVQ